MIQQVTNVISYHYAGGLGDILIWMKRDNFRYNVLSRMEPGDKAVVFLMSPNPGAKEFFTNHPKASQIDLKFNPWGPRPDGAKNHWAYWAPRKREADNKNDIELYPTEEDLSHIAALPQPHVVVSASAAGRPRSFPEDLSRFVAERIMDYGYTPVFVGARYKVNGAYPYPERFTHHRETPVPETSGVVNLIDKLSVPGTLHLIRHAAGLISCYSSMFVGGMIMRKPQLVIVPGAIKKTILDRTPWVGEILEEPSIWWHCWEDPPGDTDRMVNRYLVRIRRLNGSPIHNR